MHGHPSRANVALLSLLALMACGDTTPPLDPGPGPLVYRLVSPHDADGAVLFSVPAGAVTEVTTEPAARGARAIVDERDGVLHVAVISPFGGEIRFRMEVRDTLQPPAITILEVVDPANRSRPLSGYALEVVR